MSILSKLFTANRLAALSTFLVALAALVAAFVGVFPAGWQNAALAAVALITKLATTLKFLEGAQKSEALQARQVGPDHYTVEKFVDVDDQTPKTTTRAGRA